MRVAPCQVARQWLALRRPPQSPRCMHRLRRHRGHQQRLRTPPTCPPAEHAAPAARSSRLPRCSAAWATSRLCRRRSRGSDLLTTTLRPTTWTQRRRVQVRCLPALQMARPEPRGRLPTSAAAAAVATVGRRARALVWTPPQAALLGTVRAQVRRRLLHSRLRRRRFPSRRRWLTRSIRFPHAARRWVHRWLPTTTTITRSATTSTTTISLQRRQLARQQTGFHSGSRWLPFQRLRSLRHTPGCNGRARRPRRRPAAAGVTLMTASHSAWTARI